MRKRNRVFWIAAACWLLMGVQAFGAKTPKVYISAFYNGSIGVVLDFSTKKSGLVAIMSEEGKWDIQIKDPENTKVEYYKSGVLNGKLKRVGGILIKRRTRGKAANIGQPIKIGDVVVKYYTQDASGAHYGKIMRLGDLTFSYYSYQSLPSYGKISSIRKVGQRSRIKTLYFHNNKKGFPVAGKIRKIGRVVPVYNRDGEIKRVKGRDSFLQVEFWNKAKLSQLQQGDSKQEDDVERELDRFIK